MIKKFLNKEKKKPPQIQSVLTVEEFFKRDEYEISEEFWKMNATQLEDTCKKQEKFIKKLKTLYTAHLEYLEQLIQKHEEEKKKLKTEIEEWQIKNQSNQDLKQQIEEQYKTLYEQCNAKKEEPKPEPQTTDLLDLGEPLQEELERVRSQCIKVCEEMRRLQEDNDDLSVALDTEKQHKEQIKLQFEQQKQSLQQQINELEAKIKDIQLESQVRMQKLEDQIANKQQVESLSQEQNTKIYELESKLLQEKIKLDQKSKDCIRLEEQINEQKNQVEQMANQINILQSKTQLLETKRQKDKITINDLKGNLGAQQNNLELIQFQHKTELQNLNLKINELETKSNLYDQLKTTFEQLQNQLMDKNYKIQQLFQQISDFETQVANNKKMYEGKEEQLRAKDVEKDNIIQHLTLKREHAKVEIEQLNDKILQCMKVIDSIKSKAIKNNDIQQIIKSNSDILNKSEIVQKTHRRIQLFPTLYRCLCELRKLEDKCYKLYIQQMIGELQNKEDNVQIERYLNDIGRKTQELIDLLDEMGLR